MTMKVIRRVLAAGVALLAVAAVKLAFDVIDVSPVGPRDATTPGPVAIKPQFIVTPLEEMKDTRDRPLFSATRRPGVDNDVAVQTEDLRGLALIGLYAPGRARWTGFDQGRGEPVPRSG